MSVKRLFLFAAYDADGIVDASLVQYVRALSKFGDIVLVMDNDADDAQLKKLAPYVVHAAAVRHGEYDFGSYKRAYMYARAARMLRDCDVLYMVNDSVYAPLRPLGDVIDAMERLDADAFGPVAKPHHDHPHIQSWFMGCRPSVFRASWFNEFMTSVTKQPNKGAVTKIYEQGFSKRVTDNGGTWRCLMWVANRGIYNRVWQLYRRGLPFMKKVAFTRRRGALGGQIMRILARVQPSVRNAVLTNARRVYGAAYVDRMLTRNPFKIMYRNIRHSLHKVFVEGI
ncbi:MAG: rhamnan synthesis F family protein [Alphaproteobacteria bacterium]|nr:rhamnan synthesis F family protein [Alphaproteobacteria bacterium]